MPSTTLLTIYLASGCFWGREYNLRRLPGVVSTRTGFAGGHTENPTYQQVCTKTTGHAEAVEVVYNPTLLTTRQLLTEFFALHDATIDRCGEGGYGQYRSAIFYPAASPAGAILSKAALETINLLVRAGVMVSTQVDAVEAFYQAETRHQQYCSAHGMTPKKRDSQTIREILTSEST